MNISELSGGLTAQVICPSILCRCCRWTVMARSRICGPDALDPICSPSDVVFFLALSAPHFFLLEVGRSSETSFSFSSRPACSILGGSYRHFLPNTLMSSSIRGVPVALRAIELFKNYRSDQLGHLSISFVSFRLMQV